MTWLDVANLRAVYLFRTTHLEFPSTLRNSQPSPRWLSIGIVSSGKEGLSHILRKVTEEIEEPLQVLVT